MDASANEGEYGIVLSPDQAAAVDAVLHWFNDGDAIRFALGGFAGTGKTTIVKYIVRAVGSGVAVCAFTGKAAYVLRQKGVDACTMHTLIYQRKAICERCGMPSDEIDANPDHWCPHANISVEFVRKTLLPYRLVIVDEASMISRALMDDLESFGVPVLYVGDHGQLEPIGDNPGIMMKPNVRLEQIHRQAEGSEILALAHLVRGGKAPATTGPRARVVSASTMPRDAHEYDIVLCGYNRDRVAVNNWLRRKHERFGSTPVPGDRVVCLRNDHELGIFNGMLATVEEARTRQSSTGREIPVLDVVDDVGARFEGLAYEPSQFGAEATLRDVRKEKTLWDFGYALTVHKSQGSEWKRVLVLEQISPKWTAARWRYTAVTRAADEIVYCVNRNTRG
jgi:exodeoxyribonuclease-5